MDHWCQEDVVAFVLEELDHGRAEGFRSHLRSCLECRERVRSVTGLVGDLAVWSNHPPPPHLRRDLLDAVHLRGPHPEPDGPLTASLEGNWAGHGLPGVLRWLNQGVPHRFTGLFRAGPPTLHAVAVYDAVLGTVGDAPDAPLTMTYCSIVFQSGEPFITEDSQADPRLAEHPARLGVRSYCGVPAMRPNGSGFGTLCHYDVDARTAGANATDDLARAARLIMGRLPRSV